MRRRFIAVIGVALAAGLWPCRVNSAGSDTAAEIARQVEAHYRELKTLEAAFLETYRSGQDDIRVESGTVYFRRPGLMRWDYESPQTKLFLIDGHHVWFYVPADHTVSRSGVKGSADWRTPFALLTGKAHFKDLCKEMTLVPTQGGPGSPPAGHRVLDCQPKKRDAFLDAEIEVDAGRQVVRVLLRQPGDVDTEVRFGNWRENVSLAASLFEFTPPPGVDIVDQDALAGQSH